MDGAYRETLWPVLWNVCSCGDCRGMLECNCGLCRRVDRRPSLSCCCHKTAEPPFPLSFPSRHHYLVLSCIPLSSTRTHASSPGCYQARRWRFSPSPSRKTSYGRQETTSPTGQFGDRSLAPHASKDDSQAQTPFSLARHRFVLRGIRPGSPGARVGWGAGAQG